MSHELAVEEMGRKIQQVRQELVELRERVEDLPVRPTPMGRGAAASSGVEFMAGRVMFRNRDVAYVKPLTSNPFTPFDEQEFDEANAVCVWCFSGQLKEVDTWMLCFRSPRILDGVWIGITVKDVVGGWAIADQPERYDCEPTGDLPPAAPVCADANTGSHGVSWHTMAACRKQIIVTGTNYPAGNDVTVTPTDIDGDADGEPTFSRFYWKGTHVTLTAPVGNFLKWTITETGSPSVEHTTRTITIAPMASTIADAEYAS